MRQSDGGRVPFAPITWERPACTLAAHADGLEPADGGSWLRIGIDGAPAALPAEPAGQLAEAAGAYRSASIVVCSRMRVTTLRAGEG